MRVRGYWPHRADRAIPLPIPWVHWLDDGHGDNGDDDNGGGGNGGNADGRNHGGRGRGRGGRDGRGGSNNETNGGRHLRSSGPVPISSASRNLFIPKNPFTNPATLEGLKESFAKQRNWKASVIEGTTWEGNADAKWRKLNRIDA